MPITKGNTLEERNRTIVTSFIEEIFNLHNLPSIEKNLGRDSQGFKKRERYSPLVPRPFIGDKTSCLVYLDIKDSKDVIQKR
jgi:hypothetical protein